MEKASKFLKYKELILGIGIIAFSIFYLYNAAVMRITVPTAFNSKGVPFLLGGGALLNGIFQTAAGLREAKTFSSASGAESGAEKEKVDNRSVLLMLLVMIVYVAMLESVGFLISTFLVLFAQMMILSPKGKVRIPAFLIVSLAVTVVIYYSFRYGLELVLPSGILG